MTAISAAWSGTGAPQHRLHGLGEHPDVPELFQHAGRHRPGDPYLELHRSHVC